ncbi:MAG: DUF6326 family protein [Candidatus Hodarchaeales archaeon]|jgi:hypothetical protein
MTNRLEDMKINVKIKLSACWVTVVLIYLYADLFGFYTPGHLENVLAGELAGTEITDVLLLVFMILMTIPSLMVFLSLTLKAKVNRLTNIIVGVIQLVFILGMVLGEIDLLYLFSSTVEAVLLLLIVWYAWTWPTQEG